MDGLQYFYALDLDSLPSIRSIDAQNKNNSSKYPVSTDPQQWLEGVDWLVPIPDMDSTADEVSSAKTTVLIITRLNFRCSHCQGQLFLPIKVCYRLFHNFLMYPCLEWKSLLKFLNRGID
jgi:hypothetical protein